MIKVYNFVYKFKEGINVENKCILFFYFKLGIWQYQWNKYHDCRALGLPEYLNLL